MESEQKDKLSLIAELIVDAYTKRDERFRPDFGKGTAAIMYMAPPHTGKNEHLATLNYWYEKPDFEEVIPVEED